MSSIDNTFIHLLAIGLGQDVSFDLPLGEIDWLVLIQRAMAQGSTRCFGMSQNEDLALYSFGTV